MLIFVLYERTQSPVGVHDEGVAAVLSTELHHQPELVDPAGPLEQRHQLVFVHVPGNLPHEHLAAPRGGQALPTCNARTEPRSVRESPTRLHSLKSQFPHCCLKK